MLKEYSCEEIDSVSAIRVEVVCMHVISRQGLSAITRRAASDSITTSVRPSHSTFSARLYRPLHKSDPRAQNRSSRSFSIMNGHTATQTVEELTSSLSNLGLSKIPSVSDTSSYPTFNQIDIYRSHITELLEPITGASSKVIYSALQWTQTLDNGDLMLPVPALRLKGKKPDAMAQEIAEKVRRLGKWHIQMLTA